MEWPQLNNSTMLHVQPPWGVEWPQGANLVKAKELLKKESFCMDKIIQIIVKDFSVE